MKDVKRILCKYIIIPALSNYSRFVCLFVVVLGHFQLLSHFAAWALRNSSPSPIGLVETAH